MTFNLLWYSQGSSMVEYITGFLFWDRVVFHCLYILHFVIYLSTETFGLLCIWFLFITSVQIFQWDFAFSSSLYAQSVISGLCSSSIIEVPHSQHMVLPTPPDLLYSQILGPIPISALWLHLVPCLCNPVQLPWSLGIHMCISLLDSWDTVSLESSVSSGSYSISASFSPRGWRHPI